MNALLSVIQDSTSKTKAAGTGGASAGVLATLVVWIVQMSVYHGGAVPAPIVGVIVTVMGAVGAFLGSYLKRLTDEDLAKIAARNTGSPLAPPVPDPIVPQSPASPTGA